MTNQLRRMLLLLPLSSAAFGFLIGFVLLERQPTTYTAVATSYATPSVGTADASSLSGLATELQGLAQLGSTAAVLNDAARELGSERRGEQLAPLVTVRPRLNTAIIDTTVVTTERDEAARIANAVDHAMARAVLRYSSKNSQGQPMVTLSTVTSATLPNAPDASQRRYMPPLLTVVGAVVGLYARKKLNQWGGQHTLVR